MRITGSLCLSSMEETQRRDPQKIEMRPIGFVRRTSKHENDRDRSLVAQVVLEEVKKWAECVV